MFSKKVVLSCLLALTLAVASIQIALAHTTVTAGPYDIEIGWSSEPPIVGQMNAIVMNVSDHASGDASEDDVSGLTVTVSYGGQSKVLTLQPLGEDTPGQYVAPILPGVPGEYTVDVTGKLGDTDVKVEVQPEEVQSADTVQFPNPAASQSQQGSNLGTAGWLAIAGLVTGVAGLVVAILAWRKAR